IKTNVLGDYNYTDTTKKYRNTSVTLNPEAIAHYANREGMFNDSMESRTGWINYFPSSITYDNTVSHTGTYSLKINNSGPGEMVINSDTWTKIDNAAATTYTYSGWVKSDGTNPQAELFLFMKSETETGYATLVDNVVTTTSTDWTYFQKTFSVPSNIKKISLRVDNNSAGVLWFDDLRIQKTSEPATTLRDLNVSYNVFKSPYEIAETGVESVGFYYNFEGSRSSMFFGGTQTDRMQRPLRRHYCFDGSMETTHNTATGAVEFVTYIGGDAYSAPIIIKSDGSTSTTYYLHRDYQGSIVAITDKDGLIVEKRLYDAWGALLKVQDKFGDALSGCGIVDRGYTGHEHLSSVGLINMNARLYDPKLHRFLQPDNFVQDPLNTQNHNRYGYCLNNPLRNTDPSGEIIQAIAISAAVALVSYLAISASQGQAITLKGAIKSVIMGAVGGAVTFGIGSATSSIAHFGLKATCQALMHGMAQGGLSALQGGGFVSGFVSGALSSLGASMWQGNGEFKGFASKLGLSDVEGMLAFGGISGAAGAALTGGNIWQGACTGIIVAGLNHALHEEFGVQYKLHVLEDYEGANGFGHQALVGDIDGKLLYVSKDGTLENGGIYGEPKYTIRPSKSFTEIDDYYSTVVSPGKHYDARLTYSVTKAQMQTALRTAIQLVKMPYNLINNSCTSIVQYSLIKAGVINHVGPIPNGAFKGMRNLRPDNSSFTTPYTDSFTIRPREWGIR
ncbi:MAG TPA: RHS repeat-associated core domain-containing protein, partial [Flavobacterium sp.]|nr:RHS repeat-associated core domain-containing protein [Flavobacterium sp.]